MAMPRGDAGVRNHGPDDEYARRGTDGYARLGRAWVSADRNGPDVRADERLPLGALADADLQAAKPSQPDPAGSFAISVLQLGVPVGAAALGRGIQ
jgi:hypothetical protein